MLAKMPAVIGQQIVAPCLLARVALISLIVVTLPFGTFRINSSTSKGFGITTVPVAPHCPLIFSVIFSVLGKPLLS